MARMQDVSRRVVDVEEDGMETAARRLRIKTDVGVGHGEEVASQQANPWIRRQVGGVGKQRTLMPTDNLPAVLRPRRANECGDL